MRRQVLALAAVLGSMVVGCNDSCIDLQDICDLCNDPNHKSSCEQQVDTQDQDQCEEGVQDFARVCE